MRRMSWPEYFMSIAFMVSGRSTCLRRNVGALAVRDRHILATGYNGAPSGLAHCDETGCLRSQLNIPSGQRHEICRGIHAEQNVIIQAATNGLTLSGADLYCTNHPCVLCAKMLINCGIKHIYYADSYPDEMAARMLAEAEIKTCHMPFAPSTGPQMRGEKSAQGKE